MTLSVLPISVLQCSTIWCKFYNWDKKKKKVSILGKKNGPEIVNLGETFVL